MRRLISGLINAVVVATLVKPVGRWMLAKWRRRAREYTEATIVIPAQEFLETTLPAQLAALEAGAQEFLETTLPSQLADLEAESQSPPAEIADESAGRSMLRTTIIVGVAAAVIAGSAWAIVAVIRRRRLAEASETQPDPRERVAIPVEVPIEERADAATANA